MAYQQRGNCLRFPRLSLALLGAAILAGFAGAAYTFRLNPEIKFWSAVAEHKLDWVEQMREEHGYVIGIVGGSTTTFGIDANHLHQNHHLPVANLGLHMGMGRETCVGFGMTSLQSGDTLLLSLEPHMLEDDVDSSSLGTQLALALSQPNIINWGKNNSIFSKLSLLAQLQPGGYHLVTMLGKLLLGQPPYRYTVSQMRPGGLQTTEQRNSMPMFTQSSVPKKESRLSASGRSFLLRTRAEAAKRKIQVAYLLPWAYKPSEISQPSRASNAALLEEIREIMPVLRESQMGVHPIPEDFADTVQHLTKDAATRRSEVLAQTLKNQWSNINPDSKLRVDPSTSSERFPE